jgi:hypothetical protein
MFPQKLSTFQDLVSVFLLNVNSFYFYAALQVVECGYLPVVYTSGYMERFGQGIFLMLRLDYT